MSLNYFGGGAAVGQAFLHDASWGVVGKMILI